MKTLKLLSISIISLSISCQTLVYTDNDQLIDAASDGNDKKVKQLLSKGANVNARNHYNISVLMHAVRSRNYELVKYLLDNGAYVNVRGKKGSGSPNAIIFAAMYNTDCRITRLLVSRGADINSKTERGLSPAYIAGFKNKPDLEKCIRDLGGK